MKCKLRIITPVHIGNGGEIPPFEYLMEGGVFYRIDVDGLFRDRNFDKEKFLKLAQAHQSLRAFGTGLVKRHVAYELELGEGIREGFKVREFVKSSGKLYVPGSSIKGSILSALYWHELRRLAGEPKGVEIIRACLCKDYSSLSRHGHRVEKKQGERMILELLIDLLFQTMIGGEPEEGVKKGARFTPWLAVTDTGLTGDGLVVLGKVWGSRRGIPLCYEVLKPGCELEFELTAQRVMMSEMEILRISDEFYSKVLEMEEAWAKKLPKASLELDEIRGEKYKLRIGQGSSSLATSLLILARDLGVEKEYIRQWRVVRSVEGPKTRKVVEIRGRKYLMGWCAIGC